MSTAQRAIIIGGSMAGLFAAISLKSRGFEVAIYERAGAALINRGAGIATHDELYAAVRNAGIELREEMGVMSRGRIMFAADGTELGRLDMPQLMSSWGLIYRFLREKINDSDYNNGCTLATIEQSDDQVVAHFTDGTSVAGDWLIGADGARSQVRALLAPDITPQYVGYLGWRGLINEALVPRDVAQQFDQRMALGMAPGGHWLGYLVAGPDDNLTPGKRWYNWGWYRTADDEVLRDHLTDSDGHYHAQGIPHHAIRDELVKAMRATARDHLAPQIQSVINATEKPFIQGMYDFCCERLVFGRCILIGDAAATARPHVGLGVSKAADDASGVADALAAAAPAKLRQWEQQRLDYARAAVAWGRRLGSYIGPAPVNDEARALASYHQQPEVLMAQTAATDTARYLHP